MNRNKEVYVDKVRRLILLIFLTRDKVIHGLSLAQIKCEDRGWFLLPFRSHLRVFEYLVLLFCSGTAHQDHRPR